MRALLLSLALLLPLGAGCLASETELPAATTGAPLSAAGLVVPDGARLVEEGGNLILRFADVTMPFRQNFTLPEGATIVRAVATVPDHIPVSATLWNEETGRRRCNTDVLDAWNLRVHGVAQCSSVAAIDPPGAVWVAAVSATAPPPMLPTDAREAVVGTVDIVFETTPLDGLAGKLDLSQLSMPIHNVTDTQYLTVESFDGVPLWVEVTLPEGEGPWPTVLASSPYNTQYGRGTTPAMWGYYTHDWVKRGYAVVNADVRGFGKSGGCVEVWGENEQKDQAVLVEWVTKQDWSDGNVGFYGQSYVGTTPVAAAVQNPPGLKAIIAVAPVINAYFDWHYGGVRNGESTGSPVAYQVLTDSPAAGMNYVFTDPLELALNTNKANGLCDPTLIARANDPRAVYTDFYETRNFSKRAQDITAAVLYTQGFEDSNVKSAMIPDWFNAITAPKLGVFGHWVHQHPTRTDEEIMFLGWMDQYVKGKPLGFDQLDAAEIVVDDTRFRTAAEWPPSNATDLALQADLGSGELSPDADGPTLATMPLGSTPASITLTYDVENETALAGVARMAFDAALALPGNGHLRADLYDETPDGERALVTFGMASIAHRNGHATYEPTTTPRQEVSFELPFLPTEWVFEPGHKLVVVLSSIPPTGAFSYGPPNALELASGDATRLLLPTIDPGLYVATPATALR